MHEQCPALSLCKERRTQADEVRTRSRPAEGEQGLHLALSDTQSGTVSVDTPPRDYSQLYSNEAQQPDVFLILILR